MSFLDAVNQTSKTPEGKGQQLNEMFAALTHAVNVFEKRSQMVGTARDSQELRYSIDTEFLPRCETCRDELEQVTAGLDPYNKVTKDLASLKESLLKARRHYESLKLKYPIRRLESGDLNIKESQVQDSPAGYVSMPIGSNENTPLLQDRQQQVQVSGKANEVSQDELDFHSIVQEQRNQEISRIHSAVQEVNAIFKQLGSMVREQGEDVDNIDNNISGLSGNLQRANEQLSKADKSQRNKNKCGIAVLIIVVVVVLVVALAALS
ncbi:LAMI_0D00694g1_1 [Lachancea mirantina]|uniref:LAMI_0D00694g1_1 n=1 Tax=Lachancea mirantina TaxID=1230905 RepID=A0A1G4J8I1_9SACH|nr:LAMI_0D00694g1_1 [Lachancea mirantina]